MSLLASVRDIVDERAAGAAPPSWCARRGWADFLSRLPDETLRGCERDGLAVHVAALPDAPPDLVALAAEVTRAVALPAAPAPSPATVDPRRASPRKRAQVAALAFQAVALVPSPSRIVDLGSGHGHLTRHLAAALGVRAEGWEQDPARVAVASSLTPAGGPRFVTIDARRAAGALAATDLVVGLHACGELGDLAVRAAAAAGAAIALVGCCPQKRDGDRPPLAPPDGLRPDALTLPHAVLGLANAADGEDGVEANLATRAAAREKRVALRALLVANSHEVAPGEEMRGVNRRRATGPLEALVARAFAARGAAVPSAAAIAAAGEVAAVETARARRWELPRTMLARLIEVWIARDRAAYLTARGYHAEVALAFAASESPRNVVVLGRRSE